MRHVIFHKARCDLDYRVDPCIIIVLHNKKMTELDFRSAVK